MNFKYTLFDSFTPLTIVQIVKSPNFYHQHYNNYNLLYFIAGKLGIVFWREVNGKLLSETRLETRLSIQGHRETYTKHTYNSLLQADNVKHMKKF